MTLNYTSEKEGSNLGDDNSSTTDSVSVKVEDEICNNGRIDELKWENLHAEAHLPTPGLIGFFKDMHNKRRKSRIAKILKNVSGKSVTGEMLGIIGASGSGKTTLLNVISGWSSKSISVKGRVLYNNEEVEMRSISGYVEQRDLFNQHLTVIEHLQFFADASLSNKLSKKHRTEKVKKLIVEYGLEQCMDTKIGSPNSSNSISMGEMKQLSIVSELLKDPKILFADEPTTGLDTNMALEVMNALRKLASNGHIVICSIHQPSAEIFENFDKICVMWSGKVAFFGPTNDALEHFEKGGYPCPEKHNVAEHLIEVLHQIENEEAIGKEYFTAYTNSPHIDENNPLSRMKYIRKSFIGKYNSSIWTQFSLLMWREFIMLFRSPGQLIGRILQNTIFGILIGLLYLQISKVASRTIDMMGATFLAGFNMGMGASMSCTFTFPNELVLFRKEHKSRLYTTTVYFLTKTISEIPLYFCITLLYVFIVHFMIGFSYTPFSFFLHFVSVFVTAECSLSYGYVASAVANEVITAVLVGSLFLIILGVFGGFFIPEYLIPKYLIWIRYISWVKYGFEIGTTAIFKNVKLKCDTFLCEGSEFIEGDGVIKFFGVDPNKVANSIGYLVALTIGIRFLAYIILIVKTYFIEL